MKYIKYNLALAIIFLIACSTLYAQEKKAATMPPAGVVVSEVSAGIVAPESEFIGTVYFKEVSETASEVSGIVESSKFEEGRRITKGDILVKLNSDILEKRIMATAASYEEVLSDYGKSRKDLVRTGSLFKEKLVSEQAYDENIFRLKGLEKKAVSLKAEVERLEVELLKKEITAPFNGIIVKKHVDRGEWVSPGTVVATIARDNVVDIIAEVPEDIVGFIEQNMVVTINAGGKEIKGNVFAIVPRGDISTRTFPVKIRAKNSVSLIEGMEARVKLPVGQKQQTLTVPRDAVISMFGMTVVFAVIDSKAKMLPVQVAGYEGLNAGISAEGLSEGMNVVVKGNERLRDGQDVMIQK